MAETSGPFDSGAFNEFQWYMLGRSFSKDGVIYLNGFNDLKVTAGTGLTVNVAIGRANVAGGFLYDNSAVKNIDVSVPAPPGGGQSRIDRIVLRADFAANTITAVQKAGTASATPVPPAIQRDTSIWEVPLAQVLIPTSAVAVGTITDERSYCYVPSWLCFVEALKTASQVFTAGTHTKVAFTATGIVGNSALFDDANDRVIAPVNGLYDVGFTAQGPHNTGMTSVYADLHKNGTGGFSPGWNTSAAGPPDSLWTPGALVPGVFLRAGDYIEGFVTAAGANYTPSNVGRIWMTYRGAAYLA